MTICFSVTGEERKYLVAAISGILNTPQRYLGAPTFAYEVGNCQVDKTGTVTLSGSITDKENSDLLQALEAQGFAGEVMDRGEAAPEEGASDSGSLSIDMPLEGFSQVALDNLERLVASKATLIKKALGTNDLSIQKRSNTLRFPWFRSDLTSAELDAYTHFVVALCAAAKRQKRVTAREKPAENEKYAFRTWLLRLGFVGDQYKQARKTLMAPLSGNSAFKSGPPPQKPDHPGSHEEASASET